MNQDEVKLDGTPPAGGPASAPPVAPEATAAGEGPALRVEALEPRILLSATWAETHGAEAATAHTAAAAGGEPAPVETGSPEGGGPENVWEGTEDLQILDPTAELRHALEAPDESIMSTAASGQEAVGVLTEVDSAVPAGDGHCGYVLERDFVPDRDPGDAGALPVAHWEAEAARRTFDELFEAVTIGSGADGSSGDQAGHTAFNPAATAPGTGAGGTNAPHDSAEAGGSLAESSPSDAAEASSGLLGWLTGMFRHTTDGGQPTDNALPGAGETGGDRS